MSGKTEDIKSPQASRLSRETRLLPGRQLLVVSGYWLRRVLGRPLPHQFGPVFRWPDMDTSMNHHEERRVS
jgi:hypothetical protein